MKNTIVFLGLVLTLSICMPNVIKFAPAAIDATAEIEPTSKPGFAAGDAIHQVRLYYRSNLRDYASAKFEWSNFNGTELVFFLNARNGFGAFTGRRRMVAIFVNGKLNRIAG